MQLQVEVGVCWRQQEDAAFRPSEDGIIIIIHHAADITNHRTSAKWTDETARNGQSVAELSVPQQTGTQYSPRTPQQLLRPALPDRDPRLEPG
jgi:hypothetical protein